MSPSRRFPNRRPANLALALVLGLTVALAPRPAFAQEAAPEEGQSSGRSLDGYLACLCLAGAVLFAVGKSARR